MSPAILLQPHPEVQTLLSAYEARRQEVVQTVRSTGQTGFDLPDWTTLLMALLPLILRLLQGGFTPAVLLDMLRSLLPIILPDSALVDLALQILTILLNLN